MSGVLEQLNATVKNKTNYNHYFQKYFFFNIKISGQIGNKMRHVIDMSGA